MNSLEPNKITCAEALDASKIEHWRLLPFANHCPKKEAALAFARVLQSAANTRFFIASAPVQECSWLLTSRVLEWDSQFFACKTARLELIPPPVHIFDTQSSSLADALLAASLQKLREDGVGFMTVQVDVSDTAAIQSLERNGFLLADTIVAYELPLASFCAENDEKVRFAEMDDIPALRAISAECFGDRLANVNRFNSDLQISAGHVREMYELWIRNSVNGKLADQVFVYEEDGQALGFVTVKLPGEMEKTLHVNCANIPLNAVARSAQGRGIYRRLIRAALAWLRRQGVDLVQIRTQLPNLPVHSCWQSIGGRIFSSYHTFHAHLS